SQFGPNASRPVIRGQEGDRVKILQNGTGVLDASAASQDHAVAVEPLTIEKIEIVRGPAALLYGSNVVGGVVNMVSNRIPEKIPPKFEGKGESRFSSTDMGRSLGVGVNAAAGEHLAIHGDASERAADDYHSSAGRVKNSFNQTGSGALGASYVFDQGFIGTAFSDYESKYGTLVEEFSHINMLQQRWDISGERRDVGFFKSIRAKNSYSHYKHDEVIQGGNLGTSFKNDGDEARVDLRHKSFSGISGAFGVQANTFVFSAKGDESFIPSTNNRSYSAFAFEEREGGEIKPSLGLRLDSSQVASKDDPKFGAGQTKSFIGGSAALGLLYQITPENSVMLNGGYTERAPNYEELFAKGPHAATAQFETGDTNLKQEKSQSAELTWKHKGEKFYGSLGAFIQDFHNYISLAPTGVTDPGTGFLMFNYVPVDARFYGIELEYHYKLPSLIPGGTLEAEFKGDSLRGVNRQSGENLPRITPIRETIGLVYKADRFQTDLEVQRSEKQTLTAPNETNTGAYTFLNLGVEAPVRMDFAAFSIFARANNIFDAEGKNHVSVIKEASPLPGRSFVLGLQANF
ncbi:MAG: TonB-dependent receptor, partial [Bdellovibrionales bacterium]